MFNFIRKLIFDKDRRIQAMVCIIALMIGLFWSKVMISTAMLYLTGMTLINPYIRNNFKKFIQNRSLLLITMIFFIYAISGFYSENMDYLSERLRTKLPFLMMPFAFASFVPFSRKQYFGMLAFFVFITSIVSAIVLTNYLIHFNEINKGIKNGEAIPAPMNHIRYSLMCAIAALAGIHLFVSKFYFRWQKEKFIWLLLAGFLTVVIHVLAVRSGIVGFYCGAIAMLMIYIFRSKRYAIGLGFLAAIIISPFVAYKTIPSLRDKIGHTKYVLEQFFETNEIHEGHSDQERILTLKLGIEIGKQNPLIGVGVGDIKDEMGHRYETYCHECVKKIPHNQFIFVFAGCGLIGVFLFSVSVFFPLFLKGHFRDPFFLGVSLIMISSFMWEATIEEQLGSAIYVLFLLMPLNYFAGKEKSNV